MKKRIELKTSKNMNRIKKITESLNKWLEFCGFPWIWIEEEIFMKMKKSWFWIKNEGEFKNNQKRMFLDSYSV